MLRRALTAILEQDYDGAIECLVVFDRSTPALPGGMPSRDDRRVVALVNSRSDGLAGARNTGITAATGEFVAFCDDDDEWLSGKLSAQVSALESSPRHVLATSGIRVVGADGTDVVRMLDVDEVTHEMLLGSRVMEVHSSTLIARRDAVLDRIGLVDEGIPGSYGEDYEWLLRASAVGPILVVPGVAVKVDFHPKSFFAEQWTVISKACCYLLEHHPDLRANRAGSARIYGRLAIAEAATHHRRAALTYAGRSLRRRPRQHRSYVALAISAGVLSPDRAVRLANKMGRGI